MTLQISCGLSAFVSFNASEPFGIVSTASRKLSRLTARPLWCDSDSAAGRRCRALIQTKNYFKPISLPPHLSERPLQLCLTLALFKCSTIVLGNLNWPLCKAAENVTVMFMFCESHFCATCFIAIPSASQAEGAGGDTKFLNYCLDRFSSKRVN